MWTEYFSLTKREMYGHRDCINICTAVYINDIKIYIVSDVTHRPKCCLIGAALLLLYRPVRGISVDCA